MFRPGFRLAIAAAIDAVVLIALAPHWPALGRHLAHPHDWVAYGGADQAAATLAAAALWLCAAWFAFGLALLAISAAPGWLGEAGRRASTMLVPAVLIRVLGGVAGLSITLVAATPAFASTVSTVSTSTAPVAASNSAGATALMAPTGPTGPTWPLSSPVPPATIPMPTSAPVTAAPVPATTPSTHVVVAGDCLWDLAAAQLGHATAAQIEKQTQSWYEANRSVIGPDPSLLHPGQLLVEPT